MQYHTYWTMSTHNLAGITENSYTPHWETKTLTMLLEIQELGDIKGRVLSLMKDKNITLTCQLFYIKEVTMWLFVRSMSKTFAVLHGWVKQVDNFSFDIYTWVGRRRVQRGGNDEMVVVVIIVIENNWWMKLLSLLND